ncbi:hypothetical protein PMO31116_02772 [Pandoraea morbifera]|uniref:Uncharacterized protein n=1 Tax=Pandoraea morbifera TaxID=2508300 RepID=A0A5E4VS46_9BURK|nr:hypothetical protein [Pandoraea morbifera]VVE14359.1 hypothetical protein PMO31116_02772 [Pandoraea morbifera]
MTDSFHFSWHYVSHTPPRRPFELAGAVTPRADERFDGAVDAYCDGHYIGRCEFSSISAPDASSAAAQIRKRIEQRIEDRVANEGATAPASTSSH